MKPFLLKPANSILAQSVELIWQFDRVPAYRVEKIIPKGIVEIIFNFSDQPISISSADTLQNRLPRCFINGINTAPIHLHLQGHHSFFGVQFHPHVMKGLIHIPTGKFLNSVEDLALIDKGLFALWDQMYTASFAERVNLITQWLHKKSFILNEREQAMAGIFSAADTGQSVKSLASHYCYSSRQLGRKFHELFGMGTEEIILYKKFRMALRLIHAGDISLTKAGYASEFFDQAHFTHTFRHFAHMTPTAYRKNKSHLEGHIYQ